MVLTETMKQKAIVRFWSFVRKTETCWIWTGVRDKDGYGRTRPGTGKSYVLAHRFSYELHHGPIPTGLHILHKCDNPPCVNPDHLFSGTNRDNIDDMVRKDRQLKGDRHPLRLHPECVARGTRSAFAKLDDEKVRQVRILRAEGLSCPAIARLYGVAKSTIQRSANGLSWAHVTTLPAPEEG